MRVKKWKCNSSRSTLGNFQENKPENPFQTMTSQKNWQIAKIFDLPKIESSNVEDSEDQDENVMYTPKEKRTLLQKIFIQVLMRLCTHQPAVGKKSA